MQVKGGMDNGICNMLFLGVYSIIDNARLYKSKEQKTTQNGLVMLNDNYSINTDDYFGLASYESYLNVEYYDN